jgi:hypothetical protein
VRYEADGRRCIQIRRFTTHQRISHPKKSQIPPPPRSLREPSARVPRSLPPDSAPPPESLHDASAPRSMDQGSREQGEDLKDPAETASKRGSRVVSDTAGLAAMIGSADPASLPSFSKPDEITDLQAKLLTELVEIDHRYATLTWGGLIKISRESGPTALTEAMTRLVSSGTVPREGPYGLLRHLARDAASTEGKARNAV